MKVPVVPFLTPAKESVSHGGWFVNTVDGDYPLPKEMEHWDYQTKLSLAAPVSVDRVSVTEACSLAYETEMSLLVLARSTHTRTERLVSRLDVPQRDNFDFAVEFELAGRELGGRLLLETQLVVTEPKPLNSLAPQHPGSIVWRVTHHTDLEGVGAQFPTDAADFNVTHPKNSRAGWELRVDLSDPDALFMSAVRLTLNSSNDAVGRLLSGARDASTDQLLRTLNWDVTRQLIYLALSSEDVTSAEVDADAVTVNAILRNLLATYFPKESVVTLQQWARDNPSRIEVQLQHQLGLVS